jgi:hypothetical protein
MVQLLLIQLNSDKCLLVCDAMWPLNNYTCFGRIFCSHLQVKKRREGLELTTQVT